MKFGSILGDSLIGRCRYCDGSKGESLKKELKEWNFEDFSSWQRSERYWGYTELPERFQSVVVYIGKRKWNRLLIKILKLVHYPHLQVQCFMGLAPDDFENFFKECKREDVCSKSIFWSALTCWQWRLSLLSDSSVFQVEKVLNAAFEGFGVKDFTKWLFSYNYRTWPGGNRCVDAEIDLFYRIEEWVVQNWTPKCLDETSDNIGYITFVADKVDEVRPHSLEDSKRILGMYERWLDSRGFLPQKCITRESEEAMYRGYARMFSRAYPSADARQIEAVVESVLCKFESYQAKKDDVNYKKVGRECFLFTAMFILCLEFLRKSVSVRVMSRLRERLLLQVHCCDGANRDFYQLPLSVCRCVLALSDGVTAAAFDKLLIRRVSDFDLLINCIDGLRFAPLSVMNKDMLKERWNAEYAAWEGRMLSTGRKQEFEALKKRVNI